MAAGFFESLVSSPASKLVTQRKSKPLAAGVGLGHGALHSGTELLEGFTRNRKNLHRIFFLTKSSSDSARADCEFLFLKRESALERSGEEDEFCCEKQLSASVVSHQENLLLRDWGGIC